MMPLKQMTQALASDASLAELAAHVTIRPENPDAAWAAAAERFAQAFGLSGAFDPYLSSVARGVLRTLAEDRRTR